MNANHPSFLMLAAILVAVSLNESGLMAAGRKDDGKPSKRDTPHHVAKRSDSGKKQAPHGSPGKASHAGSSRARHHDTPVHVASHHDKGSRGSSHRDASVHHIASTSARSSHHDGGSRDRDSAKPVRHTAAASRSSHDDSPRVASHRSSEPVIRRDVHRDAVPHYSGSVHHGDPARRAHYAQRHEHHSADWYRSGGWHYDHEYWGSHHQHRYYNDVEACVNFDSYGPDYDPGYYPGYSYPRGYVYSDPRPLYYDSGVDFETRIAVQSELARAGYYRGFIDGVIGSETRSAIVRYQYDSGLRATGRIDGTLLDSLGIR